MGRHQRIPEERANPLSRAAKLARAAVPLEANGSIQVYLNPYGLSALIPPSENSQKVLIPLKRSHGLPPPMTLHDLPSDERTDEISSLEYNRTGKPKVSILNSKAIRTSRVMVQINRRSEIITPIFNHKYINAIERRY